MNNKFIYSNTPNHTDRYVPVTDEKYIKRQISRMNRMYMNNTFENAKRFIGINLK